MIIVWSCWDTTADDLDALLDEKPAKAQRSRSTNAAPRSRTKKPPLGPAPVTDAAQPTTGPAAGTATATGAPGSKVSAASAPAAKPKAAQRQRSKAAGSTATAASGSGAARASDEALDAAGAGGGAGGGSDALAAMFGNRLLGCPRCRFSRNGCSRCRNPNYKGQTPHRDPQPRLRKGGMVCFLSFFSRGLLPAYSQLIGFCFLLLCKCRANAHRRHASI